MPPKTRPDVTGRRARKPVGDPTWTTWWELNREHLIGLRGLLRQRAAATGVAARAGALDPMKASRDIVLAELRNTAVAGKDRLLRASAIIALGRMGNDADAKLLLSLIQNPKSPTDVVEAAAVALGIVPTSALRNPVRDYLAGLLDTPALSTRAYGLAVLSAGLRARHDRTLVMALTGKLAEPGERKGDDDANLVFAAGLARDRMMVPELLPVLKKGTLGRRRVSNLVRSYSALALGLSGDRNAARWLATTLSGRSTDVLTRRSCAMALARLMRETELDKNSLAFAERALLATLAKGRDPVLRGFAAVALGGAARPLARNQLMEAIDHGGAAEIKPFCALALGLSARTLGAEKSKKIAAFLIVELDKAHQHDLRGALAIAIGLSRSDTAQKPLMALLTSQSTNARVRGAAAQGLGLMGMRDPEAQKILEGIASKEQDPELLSDVALALGLMGRRGISAKLITMLQTTKSTRLQARIILALAHLDSSTAISPLLELLGNPKERPLVREFAAVGLGIIGDRRKIDVLFEVDAYFNFYATTQASNELVRLY